MRGCVDQLPLGGDVSTPREKGGLEFARLTVPQ